MRAFIKHITNRWKHLNPQALLSFADAPDWILATNFWNDTGVWIDTETWND